MEYWVWYALSPLLRRTAGWIVKKTGTVHVTVELKTKDWSQIHSKGEKHQNRCEVEAEGHGSLVQKSRIQRRKGRRLGKRQNGLAGPMLSLQNDM